MKKALALLQTAQAPHDNPESPRNGATPMKPRIAHQPQDDQQWQDAASADAIRFDHWTKTPEGQAWLDDIEQENDERRGLSAWEGW